MVIELKDVEHLAGLARITISDDEKEKLKDDLEGILSFVSQIKEMEQGEHLGQGEQGELYNIMRADGNPHESGMFTEDLLVATPTREEGCIAVKKIL